MSSCPTGLGHFPQHGYPVGCLKLQPREGTRIQQLPDGSGGLDVLLPHVEVAAFLKSLNRADKKTNYRWEPVAPKPAARKKSPVGRHQCPAPAKQAPPLTGIFGNGDVPYTTVPDQPGPHSS